MTFYSISVLVVASYMFFVAVANFVTFKVYGRKVKLEHEPTVAVLVPARNEEKTITACLESLVKQDYSNYTVHIIDDNSTDKTPEILAKYRDKYPNVFIHSSKKLPPDWNGKPHALQQVIENTQSEYLFCIDADMQVTDDFISYSMQRMIKFKLDTLSGWPKHFINSKKENFILPMVYLVTSILMPVFLIPRTNNSKLSFAIGQFIGFKRESLNKIDSYNSVKDSITEDVNIVRAMKKAGFKVMFIDLKDHIYGDMYDDFSSAYIGIKRCLNDFLNNRFFNVLLLTILALFYIFAPPIMAVATFLKSDPTFIYFGIATLLFASSWLIGVFDRRLDFLSTLASPTCFVLALVILWHSYIDNYTGKGYYWKGRQIQ